MLFEGVYVVLYRLPWRGLETVQAVVDGTRAGACCCGGDEGQCRLLRRGLGAVQDVVEGMKDSAGCFEED